MRGKLFLALMFSIFILGCGASKKSNSSMSSTDISSRGTDPITDDNLTPVGFYSHCNSFSTTHLSGVVTTFLNPMTNQYIWDYIRLKIKTAPTQLKSNDNFYIQAFRWSEDTPGSPYVNSTPVGMYFQSQDGKWLNNELITSISKSTIEKLINDNNLANTTINNFLSKVIIVMVGMDLQYDAVMLNTYDSSTGNEALTTTNVLLPAFAADPNIYAETHAPNLVALHPNYNIKDSGYTEWQFYQETQGLCN